VEVFLCHLRFIGVLLLFHIAEDNIHAINRIIVSESNVREVFSQPGCEYIINSIIDLKKTEIKIPDKSVLKFTHYGKLKNGSIVGNHTKLIGLKTVCIGVTMKGEWILPKISDSFFDTECLTDNEIIDNINTLQSSSIHNHIFLTKPEYRIVLNSKRKWGLILKDNADLNIKSILSLESNDLPNYAVIFAASNVRITGGIIIGDVGNHTYQDGTTSEWGFGILVNGSENVTIKGMRITKCIGDGIYIGGGKTDDIGDYSMASKNIYIKNVVADDNRRQGISITCADGVYIENCLFSNTGMTEFTSPGCGIDIEPNKAQSVRNVIIKKSRILDNNKILDASVGGYTAEGNKCNVENILFEDCEITGTLCVSTGSVTLIKCSMATLGLHLAKMPKEYVIVDHCTITGGSGVTIRSVGKTTDEVNAPFYSFKYCTIGMDEVLTPGIFSMINHKGNEVSTFIIENCNFIFPKEEKSFELIQKNCTCSFNFTKCRFDTKGRTIETNNKYFKDCIINNYDK